MSKKRIKKHLLAGVVSALGLGFATTVAQACAPQTTRGFLTLGDLSWDGLNYLIDNLASPINAASLVETPLITPRNSLDIMNSPVGNIDLEGGFNELLDIQPLSYAFNGNVTDQEGNNLVFESSSSPFAQPGQNGLVRRERRDPAVAEYYRPLWINDVEQSDGQETTSYRGFTFLMGDNTDPTNGTVNSPRWRDQNDNFLDRIEEKIEAPIVPMSKIIIPWNSTEREDNKLALVNNSWIKLFQKFIWTIWKIHPAINKRYIATLVTIKKCGFIPIFLLNKWINKPGINPIKQALSKKPAKKIPPDKANPRLFAVNPTKTPKKGP